MRILHVIPSISERSGGPAHAIFPMCRALLKRGFDIAIATTNDGVTNGARANGYGPNGNSHKGVQTYIFPITLNHSFKYSRSLANWLTLNVRQYDAVHIHAVFNHACVAAARACQKQQIPYVVRPLGTLDPWSMQQSPLRKKVFWQLVGRQMLNRASVVHYTAQAELRATESYLNLNRGLVIPLGVEVDQTTSETVPLEPIIGDAASHPYVLVLSRLHEKKGLDVLIEAFLNLTNTSDLSDWRLIIAGEGEQAYISRLKQIVARRKAKGMVTFVGWLSGSQKQAVLDHASLLALPSFQENFGLCVVEALASGVPVLVSPQVNLAEEINGAAAGWVSEVDVSALEGRLAESLGNEDERLRRSTAGRQFAQQFSWNKAAESLEQLYMSIKH